MKVTADEARLLRETLGDEAAHLVITGSATRGGAKHDFARFTDEELFKVMRGLTVGIALTIGDLRGFAGKAAGIVAELRTRQLASATPHQVTPSRPRTQANAGSPPAAMDDAATPSDRPTERVPYSALHSYIEGLRSEGFKPRDIEQRIAMRGIVNSRGSRWTTRNISISRCGYLARIRTVS